MTTTTKVREDSTDTLVVYPPMTADMLYAPSAADVRIGTPSTSTPDEGSETSVTPDSVATTLSAAADRGQDFLVLSSSSGVTAHRVHAIVDRGRRYAVRVRAVSGTTAYLDEPLLEDIADGADFISLATAHQLTAEQTSQSGPGLAIWRLTVNGQVVPVVQDFVVSRSIFRITLTPGRLRRRREVDRLRSAIDLTLTDLIEEAFDGVLRRKLRAAGIYEDLLQNPTEVEDAHVEAVILLLYRAAERTVEEIEAQEARLDQVLDETKRSMRFTKGDDATDESPGSLDKGVQPYERFRVGR